MSLYLPPHIFRLTTFRVPPKVEMGPDGKPRLVWVFIKHSWPLTEHGPAVKLKILNPSNARLRTAGTISQLHQLGHPRAAPRLPSRIRSTEAPFIPLVQAIQIQVLFIVEGFPMRSGWDRMTVCYLHFTVRRWAGLHLCLRCLQDIQWAADETGMSYNPKPGRLYTLSRDAGRDSHTNRRQIRPVVVYIQNVQG